MRTAHLKTHIHKERGRVRAGKWRGYRETRESDNREEGRRGGDISGMGKWKGYRLYCRTHSSCSKVKSDINTEERRKEI